MRCDALDDLEQVVRYLQLRHAQAWPTLLDASPSAALALLSEQDLIEGTVATGLTEARRLLRQVENLLAVAIGNSYDMDAASAELKTALLRATSAADFDALEVALDASKEVIRAAVEETA